MGGGEMAAAAGKNDSLIIISIILGITSTNITYSICLIGITMNGNICNLCYY